MVYLDGNSEIMVTRDNSKFMKKPVVAPTVLEFIGKACKILGRNDIGKIISTAHKRGEYATTIESLTVEIVEHMTKSHRSKKSEQSEPKQDVGPFGENITDDYLQI
jgi:hypothetical protein